MGTLLGNNSKEPKTEKDMFNFTPPMLYMAV